MRELSAAAEQAAMADNYGNNFGCGSNFGAKTSYSSGCLGMSLKVAACPNQSVCEEGFVAKQPHVQDKFCSQCRGGFAVSARQVRALHDGQPSEYVNSPHAGFWNGTTPELYRVMNQHRRCKGPTLILFKDDAPDAPGKFAPMPAACVREGGVIWLRVAYGTLVPLMTTRKRAAASQPARQVRAAADIVGRSTLGDLADLADLASASGSDAGGALRSQPFASLYQRPPCPLATSAPSSTSTTSRVRDGEAAMLGAPRGDEAEEPDHESEEEDGEVEMAVSAVEVGEAVERPNGTLPVPVLVPVPVPGYLPRPCTCCRNVKVRCDRRDPCGRCRRLGIRCTVPATVRRGRPTNEDRRSALKEAEMQAAVQLVCMHV